MTARDLGTILVDEGVLPAAELAHIESARAAEGLPLWAAVLAAQRSSEDELFFLLARDHAAAIADEQALSAIPPFGPDEERLRQALTAREAREAGVLPLELDASGTATLIMVDPTDDVSLANALERLGARRGRPLLARRSALLAAIERAFDERAWGTEPLPPPTRAQRRRDVTGTVKIDPSLAVELEALQRQRGARLPTPPPQPTPLPPAPAPDAHAAALPRVLLQLVEVLGVELEQRLMPGEDGFGLEPGRALEAGRLARRLARRLTLPRPLVEEIGVAAQLAILDRLLRADAGDGKEPFAALGWSALGEGGLLTLVRAVTRNTDPEPPLAADIVGVVVDFLALEAPRGGGAADLEALSQLLRASAGAQRAKVVDLLMALFADDQQHDHAGGLDPTTVTPVDRTPTIPSPAPARPRARRRP